jgi:hypothetical protein
MPRIVPLITAFSAVVAITTTTACSRTDTNTTTDTTTTAAPPATPPAGDERFGATMDGLSERPATVNTGATGSAEVTITSGGAITYSINVTGLSSNPTGLHIHGPADANSTAGPIVAFDSVAQTMTGTLSSGTIDASKVQGISMDSLKSLIRNGMTYVNVHTANHKDGEVRGQLTRR